MREQRIAVENSMCAYVFCIYSDSTSKQFFSPHIAKAELEYEYSADKIVHFINLSKSLIYSCLTLFLRCRKNAEITIHGAANKSTDTYDDRVQIAHDE